MTFAPLVVKVALTVVQFVGDKSGLLSRLKPVAETGQDRIKPPEDGVPDSTGRVMGVTDIVPFTKEVEGVKSLAEASDTYCGSGLTSKPTFVIPPAPDATWKVSLVTSCVPEVNVAFGFKASAMPTAPVAAWFVLTLN